jgi:O-antigen/teichoic acid export membrane protein
MVASNVAILVYNASLPMYMSIFPHFAKLAYQQETEQLKKDFHFYSKLLNTILFPFSAIVFFAAEEVLWLWTKDRSLAYATAPILQIMIIGTTMNAVITPVHTLLLAYNRVRLILYSHTVACLLMVPLTLLLVSLYGVKGGAMSIAILYAGYFFIQVILIFKSIGMQKLAFNWYIKDVLQFWLPVSIVVFLATRYWLGVPDEWTRTNLLIKLSAIGLVGCLVSLLCNNSLRQKLISKLFSK